MILMYGVFYVFASFGLTYIIGHSQITKGMRETLYGDGTDIAPVRAARHHIVDLLECPACFGFWTGIVAAFVGVSPFHGMVGAVGLGLFTAGTNLFLAKITHLID